MSDPTSAPVPTPVPTPPKLLEGFGGWLILPMIGVCLAPVRTLVDAATSVASYGQVPGLPNGRLVIGIEVALNLVLLALQIVVLVAMLRRRATFPRLFTWLWIAAATLPFVDMVVVALLLNLPLAALFDADMVRVVVGAVVMGLWVWYMHASVRVKNTFTT